MILTRTAYEAAQESKAKCPTQGGWRAERAQARATDYGAARESKAKCPTQGGWRAERAQARATDYGAARGKRTVREAGPYGSEGITTYR